VRAGAVSPALALHEVDKRYGRQLALRRLSIELAAGSSTLIAGPNGAGKSTLLRVLAGLTRPTRGEVRVLGEDPFGRRAARNRTALGYLGPEPGLYDDLTVDENLRLAARLRGLQAGAAQALLAELELQGVARRRLRELSLGYRRRAGLARALLGAPELILLDEPWNGLDAAASRQLCLSLQRRHAAGATLLIAAHAVRDYLELFSAVLTLEAGRVAGLEPLRAPAERT
jgi:heme ABC exporter ATP-binding subunit CcmA